METSLCTVTGELVPSPGAGMALACERGQGSPFRASPEDGRGCCWFAFAFRLPAHISQHRELRKPQIQTGPELQRVFTALSPREAASFFSFINIGFYFIFIIKPT